MRIFHANYEQNRQPMSNKHELSLVPSAHCLLNNSHKYLACLFVNSALPNGFFSAYMHAAAMEIILFHINRVKRKAESTSYLMGQPLNIITTHTLVFHQLIYFQFHQHTHLQPDMTHTHTNTNKCVLFSSHVLQPQYHLLSKPDLSIQVKREEKINSTSLPLCMRVITDCFRPVMRSHLSVL